MMHRCAVLLGLAVACGLATGCKQQLFVAEKDLQAAGANVPLDLETNPRAAITPTLTSVPTPPNVDDPDRPPRPVSLQEMIAQALENGQTNASQAGGPNTGVANDTLTTLSEGTVFGRNSPTLDYMRVIALNPAVNQTFVENQLARFDVQWITSMNWTTTDTLQQGLQSFQNGQSASFATSFVKALPPGGTANLSFVTDYRMLTTPPLGNSAFGVLNPSYTVRPVFGFETPLWQNFGTDINQLLVRHPQLSAFNPIPGVHQGAVAGHLNNIGPATAAAEGILIARIGYDLQKLEFERQVNALVLNVEVAYWKLYQAYGQLYSFEESLRIAHKAWMINKAKYDVGRIGPDEYAPFLAQFQEFRGERLAALAEVLERERNLRSIVGLPNEDGTRLIPITPPTQAQFQPNYDAAVKDALLHRPELKGLRESLQATHLRLIREKNFLKPDLRAGMQYSPQGVGTRLDGAGVFLDSTNTPRPTNAMRSLARNYFDDWSIGLTLNVPLGYRAEMANVRAARLNLAQHYYALKYQEETAQRYVTQQYQELSKWYHLIEMRRQERKAYGDSLQARFKQYVIGNKPADYLLEAQRRFAAAQVKEYQAIAEYNSALAKFEWGKGTILHHNNVWLSEGPLPEGAHIRAVVHERERTKAHVLREQPRPLHTPGRLVHLHRGDVVGDPQTVDLEEKKASRAFESELDAQELLPASFLETTPPWSKSVTESRDLPLAIVPDGPPAAPAGRRLQDVVPVPVPMIQAQPLPEIPEVVIPTEAPKTIESNREPTRRDVIVTEEPANAGRPMNPAPAVPNLPPALPRATDSDPGRPAPPTQPDLPPLPALPPTGGDTVVPGSAR